ncbi:type II secretion system inner membrane protein GspF [Pseudomonas sp. B21-036]|jgi:general secretion pathway protein F|uniref:type II secretion system inner membrane protein GspF n=1 Tax=Pseudomonas TaxID=286 RepID=UPI0005C15587|nr:MULTISPECIES: type II secretion system inner membrane protein GspF [Pseudomonas]KIU53321.1 general secretion pathway protein GspF [Pseudomonas putida]MCP8348816.1 type II secretion system protein GspF [Pseudomonas sp. FBF18]MEC6742145.1 type II secretion system inner membrane protein GspF [Pseudomonas qingdaonensis]OOW04413.1 type II secretion system protein GspF [Pseudomonas sp. MF6396]UVL52407.1 type II secretion system inner membrane protein GspF [Pseudomonas sp. B21-036]
MPTYRYQAVDLAGRTLKASLQAESERHARQLLREQGLFARQLQVQGNAQVLPRRQRVSRAQLCELTRQLATLTGAGIALVDALATLERQLVEPALRNLLVGVRGALAEGLGLARSLARQGGVFSALYCALVEAGERSGRLAQVLERLADHLEQVQRQQHKARTALIYPCVLMGVSLAVVVGLMSFVVPRLTEQFAHSGQSLPLITRLLIGASEALLLAGPWLLGAAVLGAAGAARLLRRPHWCLRRDDLLLRLPRVGALLRVLESARLSRSLAILVGSGVPLLEALQVATATLENRRIRLALERVQVDVQGGVSLHRALDASGQFPPMLLNMVASGEASGTLPDMLERVADNQERGFARQVDTVMALFEPLMILVMGAVVLFIVLAVLLPIMQLNQGLTL